MEISKKRTIVLVGLFISILVSLFLLTGKITYSYLERAMSDDLIERGSITTEVDGNALIFSESSNIDISATTDNFSAANSSIVKTSMPIVRLIAGSGNNATASYNVGFKIKKNTFNYSSGTNAEVLLAVEDLNISDSDKYIKTSDNANLQFVTVTDKSGKTYKGFDITTMPVSVVNVVSNYAITTNEVATHKWRFSLIFVNYSNNQDVNENAEMELEAIVQKDPIS